MKTTWTLTIEDLRPGYSYTVKQVGVEAAPICYIPEGPNDEKNGDLLSLAPEMAEALRAVAGARSLGEKNAAREQARALLARLEGGQSK